MNNVFDSKGKIPSGIWVLGFVSMLMDVSSEMIHSLLPMFLVGALGISVFTVGIIEGLAQATALIVKVFSGALSDYLDKRTLQKLGGFCIEPIPTYGSTRIRALREHLKLSQAVLASVLNTSLSTVRKWEIGDKHPSGPSQKLLHLLERKGLEAVL